MKYGGFGMLTLKAIHQTEYSSLQPGLIIAQKKE
jgi:hypothetical protein